MLTPADIPNGRPDRTALYQAMVENVDFDIRNATYNEATGQWEYPDTVEQPPVEQNGILPNTTLDQAAAAGA